MSTIRKRTRIFWLVTAILLAVSFFGPWMYDVILVPAQYTCDLPFVRLEGDFCGMPTSPASYFRWGFSSGDASSRAVEKSPLTLQEWTQGYSFVFISFLLVLPIFSSLLRLWKPDHRSLRIFHLGVVGSVVLLMAAEVILEPDTLQPALWGLWLYRIAILAALGVELGLIAAKPKPVESLAD